MYCTAFISVYNFCLRTRLDCLESSKEHRLENYKMSDDVKMFIQQKGFPFKYLTVGPAKKYVEVIF